ncbi:MAG: T9SS type A sorting domain-containing protein [Bacteroidota bacterium]
MKKIFHLAFLFISSSLLAQSGVLDNTFGNGGIVVPLLANFGGHAHAVAIQTNGNIVAGGTSNISGKDNFCLIRLNNDGTLDASFGSNGVVYTSFDTCCYSTLYALVIQSDGKILAAGSIDTAYGVARYNTDGSLDSTFGVKGLALMRVNYHSNAYFADMVLAPDGKIILASEVTSNTNLVRFNTNGSVDSTFGVNGIVDVRAYNDIVRSLIVKQDGKIITIGGGAYTGGFALIGFNQNGTIDSSFGNSGRVVGKFKSNSFDDCFDMVLQPDGKIVVSGRTQYVDSITTVENSVVARFNAAGKIDSSFGTNGWLEYLTCLPTTIALQLDGKIVTASEVQNCQGDFEVRRITANGSIDSTFGTNGITFSSPNLYSGLSDDVVIGPDGKIVIAGTSKPTGTFFQFTVVRYLSGLTISGSQDVENSLEVGSISPNPASDNLTISNFKPNSQIIITNLLGEIVFKKIAESSSMTIDVSHLPRGMYLVNNHKLVKE